MTDARTPADRLVRMMWELLQAGGRGHESAESRARLATVLTDLGNELRRLAEDPRLRRGTGGAAGDADPAPPLTQLLREVGAALGMRVEGEHDPERLAARLDELLEGFTGNRARADDENQARIRASAERAIAESLRQRGIRSLGSDAE